MVFGFEKFFIKIEEFYLKIKELLDDDIPKGYYRIEKINELLKMDLEPAFNGSNYEKINIKV